MACDCLNEEDLEGQVKQEQTMRISAYANFLLLELQARQVEAFQDSGQQDEFFIHMKS